jgi:linoleoyl-CoA desaturase
MNTTTPDTIAALDAAAPATSRILTRAESDALGREMDQIRKDVLADLGERDVKHMRKMMAHAKTAAVIGRTLLAVGFDPFTFILGSGALAVSKILENMEIGHNIMHGQYDWTRDPELDSRTYEWDNATSSDDWRHSHNFEHHTYTNIIGKDRDVGYSILRLSEDQPWKPVHAVQPVTATMLMFAFQWGIGLYDMRIEETLAGTQSFAELRKRAKPFLKKGFWQFVKDYVFFPLLTIWNAPRVLLGNFLANVVRNVWSFVVIFCGHFPRGTRFYKEEEVVNETRGEWYVRQLNGSANLEGGRLFHIATGHLSHQIEHHLFPDLPASRYPEIAPRVQDICARYGQVYNTGTLGHQIKTVAAKLVKHALPN